MGAGHQDTNDAGLKIYGTFKRETQANVDMDELAKQACLQSQTKTPF